LWLREQLESMRTKNRKGVLTLNNETGVASTSVDANQDTNGAFERKPAAIISRGEIIDIRHDTQDDDDAEQSDPMDDQILNPMCLSRFDNQDEFHDAAKQ
jgi:hypothetical protein